MKYTSFTFKNYKGIDNVEIAFGQNKISTLVGLNESGKTTILQAISQVDLLIKGYKYNPRDLNAIRPKTFDFSDSIILSAVLEFSTEDKNALKQLGYKFYSKLQLDIPDTIEFRFQFDYKLSEFKKFQPTIIFDIKHNLSRKAAGFDNFFNNDLINEIKQKLIPSVLYYEDFIFEIPNKIRYMINYDPESEEDEKKLGNTLKNQEWQDVFNDILYAVDKKLYSFQDLVVDKWQSDSETARMRLSMMEKQLDRKITYAWKQLFKGGNTDEHRLNFKEIKIVPNIEDEDIITFSFKIKTEDGAEFSINERSKGCKWFFSFLIFTEFRKMRSENILFLLDEPASNLHSSAQLKILDALDDLSQEAIVIYSTHSHHLINPKWLNGAHVVLNEGINNTTLAGNFTDTKTSIKIDKYFNYVAKNSQKKQQIYYQPIFDMLDYKRSLVELYPNTIICEGKYDWYILKYIFEVILEKENLNLYPEKGCYNNQDVIRLFLCWGVSFLLLLDGDKPSVKAKQQYIEEFHEFIADNIYTYNDLGGWSVPTDDLFSLKDKQVICDFVFGPGTYKTLLTKEIKSKFNYAISILLARKEKVNIEKSTMDKFDKIYSFLHKKISNHNPNKGITTRH